MFFARLKRLEKKVQKLEDENRSLKNDAEKAERRMAKQWENFLSYDGSPQKGGLEDSEN